MPDTVTASDEYALRFAGDAGAYLISVQSRTVSTLLSAHPKLPRRAKVLDHAGTHGQLAQVIEGKGFKRTVSASSRDLIDRAPVISPKLVGSLDAMPSPAQSFDAVVCVRLLAHADDLEATISEMCRMARQSVIVDYPSLRSVNIFSRWLFKFKKGIERDTREFTRISDTRLKQLFAQNGFRWVQTERQFLIPMALHRVIGHNKLMKWAEDCARAMGLTWCIGNPAVARFDRID